MNRILMIFSALVAVAAMISCNNVEPKESTIIVDIDESLLIGKWDFAYAISDWKDYNDGIGLCDTIGPDGSPLKAIEFTDDGTSIYTFIDDGFDETDFHDTIITMSFQYALSNNILSVNTNENGTKETTEIIRLDADTLVLFTHSQTDVFYANDTIFMVRHK